MMCGTVDTKMILARTMAQHVVNLGTARIWRNLPRQLFSLTTTLRTPVV